MTQLFQDTLAEPTEPLPTGRTFCLKRPTWKILQNMPTVISSSTPEPDGLPDPSNGNLDFQEGTPIHEGEETPSSLAHNLWAGFRTTLNRYGLLREYPFKPTHDPHSPASSTATPPSIPPQIIKKVTYHPHYRNPSIHTTRSAM